MQKLGNLSERSKIALFYLISAVFIALNAVLLMKDMYWSFLIPIGIVVALMYVYSMDKILLLITFLTPLSVNLQDSALGFGVALPTEPMMVGVMLLFFIKLLFEQRFDRKVLKHPITIAVFINLAWLLITTLTSEHPMVSVKFVLARLWFIIPFYFMATQLFRDEKNIRLFPWLYALSLSIVIFYTTYQHSLYAFGEKEGHWVMSPFYNDHTAYGMALALILPIMVAQIFNPVFSKRIKTFAFAVTAVIVIGLFFSYSRAAWLSVVAIIMVLLAVRLRIKFKWIFSVVLVLGALFYAFQFEILDSLEKNKQDSSANLVEHIQSMSNISSDASNLERINRWQSAFRMFADRPVFGFGPGTYQFEYAPYQMAKEKTIISTNAGDMGNAHSEYIGPLAETGLIGMLTILGIFITVVYCGLRVHKFATSYEVRLLSLALVLSLITYYVHGFLNNFLDSDKASVPIWGFTAAIVALDVYHSQKAKEKQAEVLPDQLSE